MLFLLLANSYLVKPLTILVLEDKSSRQVLFHDIFSFLYLPKSLVVFLYYKLGPEGTNLIHAPSSVLLRRSHTQNGYHCYCPTLNKHFVFANVTLVLNFMQSNGSRLDGFVLSHFCLHILDMNINDQTAVNKPPALTQLEGCVNQ